MRTQSIGRDKVTLVLGLALEYYLNETLLLIDLFRNKGRFHKNKEINGKYKLVKFLCILYSHIHLDLCTQQGGRECWRHKMLLLQIWDMLFSFEQSPINL